MGLQSSVLVRGADFLEGAELGGGASWVRRMARPFRRASELVGRQDFDSRDAAEARQEVSASVMVKMPFGGVLRLKFLQERVNVVLVGGRVSGGQNIGCSG